MKYLDLSYNRLTQIPKEIGNLTALEYLELAYNPITTLPVQILNLNQNFITGGKNIRNILNLLHNDKANANSVSEIQLSQNSALKLPENLAGKITSYLVNSRENSEEIEKYAVDRSKFNSKMLFNRNKNNYKQNDLQNQEPKENVAPSVEIVDNRQTRFSEEIEKEEIEKYAKQNDLQNQEPKENVVPSAEIVNNRQTGFRAISCNNNNDAIDPKQTTPRNNNNGQSR